MSSTGPEWQAVLSLDTFVLRQDEPASLTLALAPCPTFLILPILNSASGNPAAFEGLKKMKSVNLLLAGADRRMNSSIEAAVRDVCYGQRLVECTWCSRLDELTLQGRAGWLDLIIVAPGSLLPSANRRSARVVVGQAAEAIRALKSRRPIPVLAVSVAAEERMALLEAGVDNVFGFPLDTDTFKPEVRRVLQLPELVVEEEEVSNLSLGTLLLRGWQRLKNA